MIRDLAMKPFQSSFLSAEKDTDIILRKLFIESKPYSDILKSLLVVNTNDCLDNYQKSEYKKVIDKATPAWLKKNGYLINIPRVCLKEFDEKKNFLILTSDNYTPNATNPQFRDCLFTIDIICHLDLWDLGDFRLRPLKIAGYIDGILQNSKLTGIGTFQLAGASMLSISDDYKGYSLVYQAIHGSDDKIPLREDD